MVYLQIKLEPEPSLQRVSVMSGYFETMEYFDWLACKSCVSVAVGVGVASESCVQVYLRIRISMRFRDLYRLLCRKRRSPQRLTLPNSLRGNDQWHAHEST